MTDFAALSAPFPPDRVSWRVGPTTKDKSKGMALAYIDARDVMWRLDTVCGPGGWQCRYPHVGTKTVCAIGIKAGDEWVWKEDGAGDTDNEAEKGALSDAFKRAAVRFGIGRYLYDVDSPWVAIEQRGGSYVIAAHELTRLARLLGGRADAPAKQEPAPPTDLIDIAREKATDGAGIFNAWFKKLPPEQRTKLEPHQPELRQRMEAAKQSTLMAG